MCGCLLCTLNWSARLQGNHLTGLVVQTGPLDEMRERQRAFVSWHGRSQTPLKSSTLLCHFFAVLACFVLRLIPALCLLFQSESESEKENSSEVKKMGLEEFLGGCVVCLLPLYYTVLPITFLVFALDKSANDECMSEECSLGITVKQFMCIFAVGRLAPFAMGVFWGIPAMALIADDRKSDESLTLRLVFGAALAIWNFAVFVLGNFVFWEVVGQRECDDQSLYKLFIAWFVVSLFGCTVC